MASRVPCAACGQNVPCPADQKHPPPHKAGAGFDRICYGPERGSTGDLPGSEQGSVKGPGNKTKRPGKEYAECVECHKEVILRRDGRLTAHGYDNHGVKCRGSGRSPVGGRAVTQLLFKGYRLPDATVIGGGLPGHGKRA
jgi:hypothetical protein